MDLNLWTLFPSEEEREHPAYRRMSTKVNIVMLVVFGEFLLGLLGIVYFRSFDSLLLLVTFVPTAFLGIRWVSPDRKKWLDWMNQRHQKHG